jgi:phosphoribosylaminoimidazole carboxylase (NCAIR synthetase)
VTNFYEQSLRAVLDLPLGSIELLSNYVVTGDLETDPESRKTKNWNTEFHPPHLQICATCIPAGLPENFLG